MKIIVLALISFAVFLTSFFFFSKSPETRKPTRQWSIQSVDTMKYSRDIAREAINDPNYTALIDKQISDIASTGATHVAIGTPYDPEFFPVLKLWVNKAREHNLKIFFRGNFSGWEEWYGYEKIDRKTHTQGIEKFIISNPDLFEDGDIFSSCPECENGEKIDRNNSKQINEYTAFLIEEYRTTKKAFQTINKKVPSNFFSMNADMAFRIMNRETTAALDGIVVVDHYVKSPEKLERDIALLAEKSGGKIMLGELGAPIPDIHGKMTEEEQKLWISDALARISKNPNVVGVNYWVNKGGTTALWRDNGNPKLAVEVLTNYYKGKFFSL